MSIPNEGDRILQAADLASREGHHGERRRLLKKWTPDRFFQSLNITHREAQLSVAVEKGYIGLIRPLIKERTPVTKSVISYAIRGQAPILVLEELMGCGWDINSDPDYTSLSCAVAYNNIEVVNWLLAHGANPNLHTGEFPGDPLTQAAFHCRLPIVKTLIKHGANVKVSEAIVSSSASGLDDERALEVMEYLLNAGADVNYIQKPSKKDQHYNTMFKGTALHRAVEFGNIRRVEWLLDYGADWTIKGVGGLTPLEAAQHRKLVEIIRILAPLENPKLQDPDELEKVLTALVATKLGEQKGLEEELAGNRSEYELERALAPLEEKIYDEHNEVESLLVRDTSSRKERSRFLDCDCFGSRNWTE